MRRAGPVAVLALTCALALAQPVGSQTTAESDGLRVTATLSDAQPGLGEPVTLELTATRTADLSAARIEWPELGQILLGALGEDVVEVERVALAPDRSGQTALLRLYDTREFELPTVTIRATGPDADAEPLAVVELSPGTLTVAGVAPDDAERLPSHGARAWLADEEGPSWAWWALGGAVVALAGGAWLLTRARRTADAPPAEPPRPPHARALDALDALLAERLPEQGHVEAYFTRLSWIARCYVEERFGLRAPEQTTEEFLSELATHAEDTQLSDRHRELLRTFLTRADLVKFARAGADPGTCVAAAEGIRGFVVETSPTDEEAS